MCNIPIYFCDIQIKHMQHLDETAETLETYSYNMRFQRNVTLLFERTRLVVVELNTGAEVCNSAWSSPMLLWRGRPWRAGSAVGGGRCKRVAQWMRLQQASGTVERGVRKVGQHSGGGAQQRRFFSKGGVAGSEQTTR
jgi:hypothetical protein